MPQIASATPPPPRTQSRDARRLQIIEATVATLAEKGLSRMTLTAVAQRAGLSHGLVLFHFGTKDNLLAETLDYLSEEYRANWQAALQLADNRPETRIAALVRADFSPDLCTPERQAAWLAFWSEAQSLPLYQARCAANDAEYSRMLEGLCAQMNALHGYDLPPVRTARLVRIMIDGVWLEQMTLQAPYDLDEALNTVLTGLGALYPRHFGPNA